MSNHLKIEPLIADAGIVMRQDELRLKARQAGFTIVPAQRGELHVPIDQAERFREWIKTLSVANPTRAKTRT